MKFGWFFFWCVIVLLILDYWFGSHKRY